MYVDWVLITYLDQSELLLKRTGTFEDHPITSIERNEKNTNEGCC